MHNVEAKFKSRPKVVHWKFVKTAEAYTIEEWERYMNLLDNEDVGIHHHLENDVGHEKWAHSHINSKRNSIMTSNNAESMNDVNKKARYYHIKSLIEFL